MKTIEEQIRDCERQEVAQKKKKNFKELMETIKPFIRERKFVIYSTAGKWKYTGPRSGVEGTIPERPYKND